MDEQRNASAVPEYGEAYKRMPCDEISRPTTCPLPTAARDAEAGCRLYVSLIPPAPFPPRNEEAAAVPHFLVGRGARGVGLLELNAREESGGGVNHCFLTTYKDWLQRRLQVPNRT